MGKEELKVSRTGHDAMMEQDAVHIGSEADVTAHLLDTDGKRTSRHRSSGQYNADKDMAKNGPYKGVPSSNEFKIGRR